MAKKNRIYVELDDEQMAVVREMKNKLGMSSNSIFLRTAMAVYIQLLRERKAGGKIKVDNSETGEVKELLLPDFWGN